jgi:hypothetical protein
MLAGVTTATSDSDATVRAAAFEALARLEARSLGQALPGPHTAQPAVRAAD